MGDMADLAYEQVEREQDELHALLCKTDFELYNLTSRARIQIVKKIRGRMSKRGLITTKERYVLASWIMQHE